MKQADDVALALRLRALTSLVVPHSEQEYIDGSDRALILRCSALQDKIDAAAESQTYLRKALTHGKLVPYSHKLVNGPQSWIKFYLRETV